VDASAFAVWRDAWGAIEAEGFPQARVQQPTTAWHRVTSLHGSENSDQDMSAYVRAADAVREVFQCAVIIVHHCGHGADRPRGHSALIGAADAVLAVRKDATGELSFSRSR